MLRLKPDLATTELDNVIDSTSNIQQQIDCINKLASSSGISVKEHEFRVTDVILQNINRR